MNPYLFILLLVLLCAGCNPRTLPGIREGLREMDKTRTEETRKVIGQNPKLKELDNWCRQIPLPDTFNFVALQLGRRELVSYYYLSSDDFDRSDKYFNDYFSRNGWMSNESTYNNRVSVYKNKDKR